MKPYVLKKRRKRPTLVTTLLRNYVISFILMLFVLISSCSIAILIAMLYFDILPKYNIYPNEIMVDDYTKIDSSEIESVNGFILILDKDFNILYKRGNSVINGDKLNAKDLNTMIYNSEDGVIEINPKENTPLSNFTFKTRYNSDKDFLLVVAIPKNVNTNFSLKHTRLSRKQFLIISVAICLLILTIIFILYARITSRYFIKPLQILTEGANKLAKGNYSTRIGMRTRNEFGELSDALNIMAQKIEEERKLKEKSEKARRRLILDISHDLKNPLASIMGYSDYLIKNEELSKDDLYKYLKIIESNSIRANSLIQDLFEFSKLESVDFKLNKENQDICEFLRELIASYIPMLEEKQFNYDFLIPDHSIKVNFDSKHLDRALSNIILNSIKYNKNGASLNISLDIIDNFIEICIQDDGIGIEQSKVETIFDPFVREDEARNSQSGGTGLGLAITKTIIEKHNGTITLESKKNEGCKFTIFLPL